MTITFNTTKRVVRDLAAAEKFYCAMGMKVAGGNVGGDGEARQEQRWLTTTGDFSVPVLILTRFLNVPPPARPKFPGEAWLVFNVADVDATCKTAAAHGATIVQAGQDQPDYKVRAAILTDPEGHAIELVGPMA